MMFAISIATDHSTIETVACATAENQVTDTVIADYMTVACVVNVRIDEYAPCNYINCHFNHDFEKFTFKYLFLNEAIKIEHLI